MPTKKKTGPKRQRESSATHQKQGGKGGCCREEKTKENGTNQEVLFIGCLWTRQAPQGVQTISEGTVNTLNHLLCFWPLTAHHWGQIRSLKGAVALKVPQEGVSWTSAIPFVKNSSTASFCSGTGATPCFFSGVPAELAGFTFEQRRMKSTLLKLLVARCSQHGRHVRREALLAKSMSCDMSWWKGRWNCWYDANVQWARSCSLFLPHFLLPSLNPHHV